MNKVYVLLFITALSSASAKRWVSTDSSKIPFRQMTSSLPMETLPLPMGQGKIVGGNEAIPYSLPYQVLMLVGNSQNLYFCGGSIISTNYVLTSARNLYEAEFAEIMLAVHNYTFPESSEPQVNIMAIEFIIHELWDPITLSDDIGLVRLSSPAPLNEYIQPAKMPRYSDVTNNYEGDVAKVSGWGKARNDDNFLSRPLRFVDVPVMNHFDCGMIYFGMVTENNICTVGDGGKGVCVGDAGGPLVLDDVQIGIVSFIYWDACESGNPSVYTRVTSYLDWIATNSDVVIEP